MFALDGLSNILSHVMVEYLTRYALWPGETVGAHSRKGLRSIGKQTVVTMGGLGSWMQGNAMPEIVTSSFNVEHDGDMFCSCVP